MDAVVCPLISDALGTLEDAVLVENDRRDAVIGWPRGVDVGGIRRRIAK